MAGVSDPRRLGDWLDSRRLLVCDGAMGTELQAAGLTPGGCPELWNVESAEAVLAIMARYRAAGAELLETNSFGGSPHKLGAYGIAARCREINVAAARIGRAAAGEAALVVGSIGPTGALLEPLGPLRPEEAYDGFVTQARALAEGGVDAFCVETMTDLVEATLAVRAAATTGLPVMATMTFEPTPRGFFTIMGVDVPTAARELAAAGASALGTNCGTGPAPMVAIVRLFRQHSDLPLLVQANAGVPELRAGEVLYPEGPHDFASHAAALVDAGATMLGGCCGTTPAHIHALALQVRELRVATAPNRGTS